MSRPAPLNGLLVGLLVLVIFASAAVAMAARPPAVPTATPQVVTGRFADDGDGGRGR